MRSKTLFLLPLFASLLVSYAGSAQAEKSYSERYNKENTKQEKKRQSHQEKHRSTEAYRNYQDRRSPPARPERPDWAKPKSRPERPDWAERKARPERPKRPEYRYPEKPTYERPEYPKYKRPEYRYERPEYKNRHETHYRTYRRPHKVIVVPSRRVHNYIVIRPFRYSYPHYRVLRHDDKLWGWLAFTAITLRILDYLDDQQQREHERALYRATQVPLGTRVVWSDRGDVYGSVTPVWEGPSNYGQFCREFKHEVTIDNRTEIAYGTACKTPDGYWQVVQ